MIYGRRLLRKTSSLSAASDHKRDRKTAEIQAGFALTYNVRQRKNVK